MFAKASEKPVVIQFDIDGTVTSKRSSGFKKNVTRCCNVTDSINQAVFDPCDTYQGKENRANKSYRANN